MSCKQSHLCLSLVRSECERHIFFFLDRLRSDGGRGSPKPDVDSRDLLEERVSTRGSAASPTGAHVADIYLANLNKWVACTNTDYLQCYLRFFICNNNKTNPQDLRLED